MGNAVNVIDKAKMTAAAIAPFTGPAAPFVLAAVGLVNLGESIYHLFSRYDPTKLHDTAVVEAFAVSWHMIWYSITGEELPGLPGVTPTTNPGNYGAAGIDLFRGSSYPNVPMPAGNSQVDINAAFSALQQTYQAAANAMERPESIPNLTNNYNYFKSLLLQVAQAQQQTAAADLSGLFAGAGNTSSPSWLPWALAAAALLVVST